MDKNKTPIAGWKLASIGLASIVAVILLMRLRAPMGAIIPLGLFASWGGIPMLTVGVFRLLKSGAAQLRSRPSDDARRNG